MCGIAGICSTNGPIAPEVLSRALPLLRHRGPDDEGTFFDQHCGLAHCRLSILDLSSAGHQPMKASGVPVWITYNGEIYNYRELRQKLTARGFTFLTATDTEVILNGYLHWGVEIFARLRGMFALGLWDQRSRQLVLARDPYAIKPLYYFVSPGGSLSFASELKALMAFPEALAKISPTAVGQFIRYLYVPEPLSIYEGVERVPAGHTLTWSCGKIECRSFVPPAVSNFGNHDVQNGNRSAEEQVTATVRDSVAAHLVSDVPVGAFFSGGVDSSLVVALMRQLTTGELHTFSIVYGKNWRSFDESSIARAVAQRIDVKHHEIQVTGSIATNLEPLLDTFDEPFGNPAALIAGELSRYTRQYVKVVLSGVGGDELFGGYPRYLAMKWYPRLRHAPAAVVHLASEVLGRFAGSPDRKNLFARLHRLLQATATRESENFWDDISCFATPGVAASLLNRDLGNTITWRDGSRLVVDPEQMSPAWAMAVDARTYLPGDLLTYTDRASMRYGLEVRTPFIDREVATVASRLPDNVKLRGFETKWLLKKIASHHVPARAIYRTKKGFSVPLAYWLRNELRPAIREFLAEDALRQWPELEPAGVRSLVARHRAGDDSIAYLVWAMLVYVLWRQRNKTAYL